MSAEEPAAGGAGEATSQPSAEERAEELVQRATTTVTRFLTHAFARAREEVEDIVAEGRELHRNDARHDA